VGCCGMSAQTDLSEWGAEIVSREALLDELQRLAGETEGLPLRRSISDASSYDVSAFEREFGTYEAALVVAGVAAHPDDLDIPEWVRCRYGAAGLEELLVVAGRTLDLPAWTLEFDRPVARSTASSRNRFHAPAIDVEGNHIRPRCELRNRDDEDGDFIANERGTLKGFYSECGNPDCQEWFDAVRGDGAEGGLPRSSVSIKAMTNGGDA